MFLFYFRERERQRDKGRENEGYEIVHRTREKNNDTTSQRSIKHTILGQFLNLNIKKIKNTTNDSLNLIFKIQETSLNDWLGNYATYTLARREQQSDS